MYKKNDNDNYNILISILMVVIGLVVILWPGHVMTTAMKVLGIALLAGGALSVFSWSRGREKGVGVSRMAQGIAMLIAGAVVLIVPKFLISIIPIAVGLIVVFNGILNIAQALDLRREGYDNWVVSLILAALTLLLGLVIVFNPFSTMEKLVAAIGVVILYNGASNLWIESRYRKII